MKSQKVQLELYFKLLKGTLERIGGEMIRTKFSATVTNTGQGLEVTSSDLGNLYILVKDNFQLMVGRVGLEPTTTGL
ncbi:MAG: hypothetical protein RLZZ629_710 [Actinomycetota bacterium]